VSRGEWPGRFEADSANDPCCAEGGDARFRVPRPARSGPAALEVLDA